MTENTKKIYNAVIEKQEKVSKNSWYMEFNCGRNIKVNAGQFVSVYCKGLTLRRPFSVFSNFDGKIGILYKERGMGTQYLKSLKAGDKIDITGPFGNGFKIENKKSLLIGAGIGCAPVSFLKSKLDIQVIENRFICGFTNKDEIPFNLNADAVCTDDGSEGEKGSVINILEQLIKEYKPKVIYACGPEIVLKLTAQAGKEHKIPVFVSMEKVMACSIGVCRGCVIDVMENGKIVNKAVCKDGPVFLGSEVFF